MLKGNPVWMLFSVVNDYDQPDNNLVAWDYGPDKPSLGTVADWLETTFPGQDDEHTLQIVRLWSGDTVRIGNTDYRLEQMPPGRIA